MGIPPKVTGNVTQGSQASVRAHLAKWFRGMHTRECILVPTHFGNLVSSVYINSAIHLTNAYLQYLHLPLPESENEAVLRLEVKDSFQSSWKDGGKGRTAKRRPSGRTAKRRPSPSCSTARHRKRKRRHFRRLKRRAFRQPRRSEEERPSGSPREGGRRPI